MCVCVLDFFRVKGGRVSFLGKAFFIFGVLSSAGDRVSLGG